MNGRQHQTVGIGAGIGTGLALFSLTNDPFALIGTAVGSAIGCWGPDIDHDKTKIGRKRKAVTTVFKWTSSLLFWVVLAGVVIGVIMSIGNIITYSKDIMSMLISGVGIIFLFLIGRKLTQSKLFKWATDHRGFMHTLAVPLLLGWLAYSVQGSVLFYPVVGFLNGYVSHLIADMFTVSGCPILFPLTRKCIRIPGLNFTSKNPKLNWIAKLLAFAWVVAGFMFLK